MNITIVGNGVFGDAMQYVLRQNTAAVSIAKRGKLIENSEIVVLSVPTQAIREVLPLIKFPEGKKIIVNTAKGIERKTHKFPYQIVEEVFGNRVEYYSLMGPSFAQEIKKDMPTLVNIGYRSGASETEEIKKLFHTDFFHIRLTEGVEALEIASAMKNIYAMGCGLCEGLGYGENTKAKLLTLAIEEMQQLFKRLNFTTDDNATAGTLGDLILTCASLESRNCRFGKYRVTLTAEEALKKINSTVEGYNSVESLILLRQKANVSLPLAMFIAKIVKGNDRDIKAQFENFMKKT
jgi:glycerol-3-phosphate dehydrogenase (NAD(P)+)